MVTYMAACMVMVGIMSNYKKRIQGGGGKF